MVIILGYYFPDIWLSQRIAIRRRAIVRAMPYTLDLLTLSVEAGLDFIAALPVHVDPLIVVVDRDRKLLLGLFLTDDVLVKESLHFQRLGEMVRGCRLVRFRAVVFQDGIADRDAFITDVSARVIAGRGD